MKEDERCELGRRLHKAMVEFGRYKQLLIDNPEKRGQLEPILQGYKGLIGDLGKDLQHLEAQETKVEMSPGSGPEYLARTLLS